MSARSQLLRSTNRLNTNDGGTAWIEQRLPAGQYTTDIILFTGHHLAQTQILRGRSPVEFITRGVSLLDAHDPQRLGAVRNHPMRSPGLHQHLRHAVSISSGKANLVG